MKNTILQTGIQYGIQIAAALIMYFVLMTSFNLSQFMELRFFNIVIMTMGIYYSIKNYQVNHAKNENDYLEDIGVGISTVFVSTLIFSIFMYGYMQFINPEFIKLVQDNSFGEIMNVYIIAFSIFIEGMGFGAISTFITMQWLKTDHINLAKKI